MEFPKSNLRSQGSLFPTCSFDHFIYSVQMSEYLPVYCNQSVSPPLPFKQTPYTLPPCNQPESPPLLWNWAESPRLYKRMTPLAYPYANKAFTHRYIQQKTSDLPAQRLPLRPIQMDLLPNKNFTPDSSNQFHHPGLGLMNPLSFRAIDTGLHLPW